MRISLFCTVLLLLLGVNGVSAEETVIPKFDINRILLDGNTILKPEEVAAILARYTGPQKDFGTVQEAMEELETAYRKRGYTMVTVILPEQELVRGIVTITVVEPVIREIIVEGNKYYSRDNILRSLPTLRQGEPPRVTAISENLRAANENPGKKVVLQFKGAQKPEDLQAVLKVQDQKPWKVSLSADNTGTRLSGEYRVGLGLQHYDLWGLDHVAAVQYQTSTDYPRRVNIVSGSYRIPFYSVGDTLDLFGGYSNVDNGTTQISGTDLQVSGKGYVGGFRYNLNIPRVGSFEHKFLLGMDYRFYDNSAIMQSQQLATDVTAHPVSATYAMAYKGEAVAVEGYVGGIHNDPWGYKGNRNDFEATRTGANPRYWIVRYGANTTVKPIGDWLLRLQVNGQYTDDRMIPGEQFGLGGATAVRGYQEREESFDAGLAGSAELYSPDLAKLLMIPETQLRLLGFYDVGYGYTVRQVSGERGDHALDSAGVGMRVQIGEYFSVALDWAQAFRNSISSSNPTKARDHRIHFRAQVSF